MANGIITAVNYIPGLEFDKFEYSEFKPMKIDAPAEPPPEDIMPDTSGSDETLAKIEEIKTGFNKKEEIEKIEEAKFLLYVNEQLNYVTNDGVTGYMPNANDFLMFSKYSQESGEVTGYYAKAKFVNNSKEKAEIFAVSSEVIINSK